MMSRATALFIASALALVILPAIPAVADHTDQAPIRCDGGYCSDGEDHVLDCSQGHCTGDHRGFPTLVNPSYEDGDDLAPDDVVLGVDLENETKAYPIEVLNWFEIVEERFGDEPVAITYCPLCGSGIVWSRQIQDRTFHLYNTGAIWKNDLVMYDTDTESWWTQVGGEAIKGPLHGWTLELLPSTVTTWEAWRGSHPDTQVLERPVDAQGQDLAPYDRDPYASYRSSESTPQARHVADESGLHPKTRIVGVEAGEEAFAFPVPVMREQQVLETEVGDLQLVAGYAGQAVHVYLRGERSFEPGPNATMLDGQGTGWDIGSGRSLDGQGQLERIPSESLFWFAWLEFHPGTGVLTEQQEVLAPRPDDPRGTQDQRQASWVGAPGLLVAAGLTLALARRAKR